MLTLPWLMPMLHYVKFFIKFARYPKFYLCSKNLPDDLLRLYVDPTPFFLPWRGFNNFRLLADDTSMVIEQE
jgi:hypothetical protein